MSALLSVANLEATYGASQALFGVGLDIAEGEAVALMGRNGVGKSTTVKCICRMIRAQGAIRFAGHDLMGLSAHEAARLGIGLVPEGRRCFAGLSVHENLVVAARPGRWRVAEITELFPRLGDRLTQSAGTLSGGEQQMLAIGRALMTNPRLLILDEATEGLAPLIRQEIWAAIRRLKAQDGLSLLVIDKSLAEMRMACDRAVILAKGHTVWRGPMATLGPEVVRDHVGL